MSGLDLVEHPSHYTSSPACCSQCGHPIECIDVTKWMNFSLGSAVKYIWRQGLKVGAPAVQDLEKAIVYLKFEIERLRQSGE